MVHPEGTGMIFALRPRALRLPRLGAPRKGQPMDFSVQATLSYRVQQETPFVFNVQAQTFTGQTITSESLSIEPELLMERPDHAGKRQSIFPAYCTPRWLQDHIPGDRAANPTFATRP